MELFYSSCVTPTSVRLSETESGHCVRVLRHKVGDEISVIDGCGTLLKCRLTIADPSGAEAVVLSRVEGFGDLPYSLTMAVCPTKNTDRYEWFVEKATEFGFDALVPVIGRHSERKVLKTERLERILLSATKQSLKARVPHLAESQSVSGFLQSSACLSGKEGEFDLKLIACCFEPQGGRRNIACLLSQLRGRIAACVPAGESEYPVEMNEAAAAVSSSKPRIAVLIGPEGDFSEDELTLALANGWVPVSLGGSRLRTETAALASVAAVYFTFCA